MTTHAPTYSLARPFIRFARPALLTLALAGTLGIAGCFSYETFTVGEMKAYVITVPPGTAINLSSTYGDVDIAGRDAPLPAWTQNDGGTGTIAATEGETVVVAWFRSSHAERLEQVTFTPTLVGGTLTLDPQWPAQVGKSKDAVYFAIRTPYELGAVALRTGYGDVDISLPHESAQIKTGYGDVNIADTHGATDINTGYGDVGIARAAGPINLTSGYGDLDLSLADDFTGGLTISTGYGDIDLRSPTMTAGEVVIKTGYGDIDLSRQGLTSGRPTTNKKRSATISGDPSAPAWTISTGYGDIDTNLGKE